MKSSLALIGLVLALAGLGVAIFQDEIRDEQPTSVESLAQDAMDAGKKAWDGSTRLRKDKVTYAYMGLGALGFLLGLAGLVKKENAGMGLAAMIAGAVAALWHLIL